MSHSLSKAFFAVLILALTVSVAYSFEDDSYSTPDNWKQHVTAGRIVQSTSGSGLTDDTSLYTTLTTRLRLKSNEYAEDSDVYQYIRMHTDAAEVGNGTVKLSIFGRITSDINGDSDEDWGDNDYYAQRDILDADSSEGDLGGRLYQGYLQADGVIKNTKISIGRFYLDHLTTYQVDGIDAQVNVTDNFSVYAFGGLPVSYFYDLEDSYVAGAGFSYKYMDNTIFRGEYSYAEVDDIDDDHTQLEFVQLIPNGSVMLGYELLNDADTYSADLDYQISSTGTIVTLGFERLNDDIEGSDSNYLVNPITYALMDQSKYSKYKASVYQPFMKYFVAGLSYEAKSVDGDENFDNRDYQKYGAKFDINGLISDGTYISLNADKWAISDTDSTDDNNRIMYGLQVSQKVNAEVDVWLGSSFSKYEYDYLTDTRKDSVRSYYVGGQYQPSETLGVLLDVSREETEFYDDVDDDLSDSYVVELWANIAF
ncbi:hypothetical protein Dacet_0195 [Denitrovibrio acetiphilus DSM 12809]|uniref:Alginate export domain-containing protein n=1 Tax=Denitrovibrio acetiphilus (strain DSM 12809 / NBRC 114555 / N2460) TaxID=522772 RepID=D4H222_DENA2|nr:hypothetical protein [Denitrovibrio acetiphilus]ADD66999.1 hypothetical protein Dacet_0195 [Denitrovibrio acetiphilus DSM 12809]